MGAVVHLISASRDQQIVEVLEFFLAEAKQGRLRSFECAAEHEDGHEDFCVAGAYRARPALGLAAATRLTIKVNEMIDESKSGARGRRPPKI